MQRLIELTEDHYIIVDDSRIKEGDWICMRPSEDLSYTIKQTIDEWMDKLLYGDYRKKITHSTTSLHSNSEIILLDLSEAKALVGKVYIEQLAEQYAKAHSIYESAQDDVAYGFREGYIQCLEYNKDKKYTENDIFNAIGIAIGLWSPTYASFEQGWKEVVLKSLQPKKEWEVTFENGKLKLL